MEYYDINKSLHTAHFNNINEIKSLTSTLYFIFGRWIKIFPLFYWSTWKLLGISHWIATVTSQDCFGSNKLFNLVLQIGAPHFFACSTFAFI